MSNLTAEQTQWLSDNRRDYEFYLLHSIMHDPMRRSNYLTVPLVPDDFRDEHYALVIGGIVSAQKILGLIGQSLPFPPTEETLRTYVESAANHEGFDREEVDAAMQLVRALQDPSYKEQYYCLDMYFTSWYSSIHAKRAARKIQMLDVPDVTGAMEDVQKAMNAAHIATTSEEDDDMYQLIHGEDDEQVARRPTGIQGLDDAMNGGWGEAECTLMFSGTGGGKSIATGQCALHEASTGGFPLIVSTELAAREYAVRIVSAAASVPINVIQDCKNFKQIRQAVAAKPALQFLLPNVEKILKLIEERIRIVKISADDGLAARAVLEREYLRYERMIGTAPTWGATDWLGSIADVNASGKGGTSERAFLWELSANQHVKFCEDTGLSWLVLAQAVNDAQLKRILTLSDIGISKGIGKNMVNVIGITNTIDQAGIKAATLGKAEMPKSLTLEDQFYCVCKARKGEGNNIPVRREFRYQRFSQQRPKN